MPRSRALARGSPRQRAVGMACGLICARCRLRFAAHASGYRRGLGARTHKDVSRITGAPEARDRARAHFEKSSQAKIKSAHDTAAARRHPKLEPRLQRSTAWPGHTARRPASRALGRRHVRAPHAGRYVVHSGAHGSAVSAMAVRRVRDVPALHRHPHRRLRPQPAPAACALSGNLGLALRASSRSRLSVVRWPLRAVSRVGSVRTARGCPAIAERPCPMPQHTHAQRLCSKRARAVVGLSCGSCARPCARPFLPQHSRRQSSSTCARAESADVLRLCIRAAT